MVENKIPFKTILFKLWVSSICSSGGLKAVYWFLSNPPFLPFSILAQHGVNTQAQVKILPKILISQFGRLRLVE